MKPGSTVIYYSQTKCRKIVVKCWPRDFSFWTDRKSNMFSLIKHGRHSIELAATFLSFLGWEQAIYDNITKTEDDMLIKCCCLLDWFAIGMTISLSGWDILNFPNLTVWNFMKHCRNISDDQVFHYGHQELRLPKLIWL